jgi:hypothetical protein
MMEVWFYGPLELGRFYAEMHLEFTVGCLSFMVHSLAYRDGRPLYIFKGEHLAWKISEVFVVTNRCGI